MSRARGGQASNAQARPARPHGKRSERIGSCARRPAATQAAAATVNPPTAKTAATASPPSRAFRPQDACVEIKRGEGSGLLGHRQDIPIPSVPCRGASRLSLTYTYVRPKEGMQVLFSEAVRVGRYASSCNPQAGERSTKQPGPLLCKNGRHANCISLD